MVINVYTDTEPIPPEPPCPFYQFPEHWDNRKLNHRSKFIIACILWTHSREEHLSLCIVKSQASHPRVVVSINVDYTVTDISWPGRETKGGEWGRTPAVIKASSSTAPQPQHCKDKKAGVFSTLQLCHTIVGVGTLLRMGTFNGARGGETCFISSCCCCLLGIHQGYCPCFIAQTNRSDGVLHSQNIWANVESCTVSFLINLRCIKNTLRFKILNNNWKNWLLTYEKITN